MSQATQYQVVSSDGRKVSPIIYTPSRAIFYQRAFSAQWPGKTYEISIATVGATR